jgi:hypothetical protein
MIHSTSALAASTAMVDFRREVRIAYDMTQLRLEAIPKRDAPGWAVLRVNPGPLSGMRTGKGVYVQAETGRIITPPGGGQPIIRREGTWEDASGLQVPATAFPAKGTYGWYKPWKLLRRPYQEPDQVFSPFVGGGVVLCKLPPKLEGEVEFRTAYMIPPDWAGSVSPAYKVLADRPSLFEGPLVPANVDQLIQLARDQNPLVSVTAFRRLIELRDGLDQQSLPILRESRDSTRGILLYMVMAVTKRMDEKTAFAEIGRGIESAATESALEPTAVAAFAVAMLGPDSDRREFGQKVLSAINVRLDHLTPVPDQPTSLRSVLYTIGIRKADRQDAPKK